MDNPVLQAPYVSITPELQEIARPLVGKLALTEVSMLNGTFQRFPLMDIRPLPAIMLQGQIQTSISLADDGMNAQAVIVINAFGTPIDAKPSDPPGFNIQGTYRLSYVVQDGELAVQVRREALQAMVGMSAPNHIWGFWREFALQASQRMGIPPVILPLLFTVNIQNGEAPKTAPDQDGKPEQTAVKKTAKRTRPKS
jgi:hypothetical protein